MNIRVYKSKYEGFSTVFSSKAMGIKYYLPVQFKRGIEPLFEVDKGYVDINPKNWFGSCYKKKNGDIAPKIVVMDYELEKEQPTVEGVAHDYNSTGNDPKSLSQNQTSAVPSNTGEYDPFSDDGKEFH